MKVLIQSEFQNTIQKYKSHLDEVSSTVAMLQQHMTNLKQEHLNFQERTRIDRQDLEKYCEENEQYSRRLCLRIKNLKKQENESSKKVLEEIKCLFSGASINIPDACIDRAHRVSKTDDTVIVTFATFRHRTMFYRKRKELKNGVKVHLDLTKARLDLLIKADKYVKNLSNVDFVYADINCRLKIHFSNNNESFFDSMDDLISKTGRFFKLDLDVFFLFSVIQMISLLEVSTKEVMLRRSFSRFSRFCEEWLFGSLSVGKL